MRVSVSVRKRERLKCSKNTAVCRRAYRQTSMLPLANLVSVERLNGVRAGDYDSRG